MAGKYEQPPMLLMYVNGSGNRAYYFCEDGAKVRAFIDENHVGWRSYELFALDVMEAWRAAPGQPEGADGITPEDPLCTARA